MSRAPRSTVSAIVTIPGALKSVEFAEQVLGATRRMEPIWREDGSLWQVELDIDGATVIFSEASGPVAREGYLRVEVADARKVHARALEYGAREITPVERRLHGADDGGVEDSGGTWWLISTQVEDPNDAEIAERAREEEASQ